MKKKTLELESFLQIFEEIKVNLCFPKGLNWSAVTETIKS